MLPGIDGHLLSSAFIEQQLLDPPSEMAAGEPRAALIAWRRSCGMLGPASTARAVLRTAAPLFASLGYEPLGQVDANDSIAVATLRANDRNVAVIVGSWGDPMDPLWRSAVVHAGRNDALWCLIFNGLHLRIVDARTLYARRYLEVDLDLALDNARTFAALVRLFGAGALTTAADDPRSLHILIAASDRHAAGVCRSLRDGVLAASAEILRALVGGHGRRTAVDLPDTFEQALTIVYRILFLLFAEARALVPLWHPVYRESYSLEGLRDAAEGPDRMPGLWEALRAIARLAHAGCRAGDLQVTAFNGRLFAPARTPLAERRGLDDEAARNAIVALSTRPAADRAGRERIAYRDLGVEQLGAVYETLLDYEPRIDRGVVSLQRGSGVRKATGTFYTPQPIADYLVRRTLDPLVREATPDRILQLRIVDPAMGSGAFLVAACRFLAAAYESALLRAGGCHPTDLSDADRVAMRRTIAERVLYGVDLNPMAVQLARLSLWLTTLAADRPLSFLDHRLQVGDSLLGTWLSHLRTAPPAHRRRTQDPSARLLFGDEEVASALREALPVRFSLEGAPNDTVEQVRAKERALAGLSARGSALARWKRVAHLWCAPWLGDAATAPPASAFGSLSDAALTGRSALPESTARRYLDHAEAAAESRRLFHWELEFPEVFFDRDGIRRPQAGFDAVIGNPPWDMLRADQGEAAARARTRLDTAPVLRFTRDAGIYTAQSGGHANRYQLFVERAIALTRAGGRLGLVLPSGLATDQGSAALRRLLLSRCRVDAIVGMDNHRGVFPIHRSVRFLLITASAGAVTDRIACHLGVDDPADLAALADPAVDTPFPLRLSPALLQRISGPDLALPNLRSTLDLAIVERAANLFPPLGAAEGWGISFGRELNASDDRGAFRDRGLPVVEGKHLEPFRAAVGQVRRHISASDARRLLRSDRHEHPRLAYRDVASATNRVTLIAAVLPARCVSTHTVFCLRNTLGREPQHLLCGFFNSFVVNYLVRLRVTTHVTTGTVERLPIPTAAAAPAACHEIAAIARRLAKQPDAAAFARLNALVAHLYQLSTAEFEHILSTFPLFASAERSAALDAFTSSEF